jgi:hypothetical protein
MKNLIFVLIVTATTMVACNSNRSTENQKRIKDTLTKQSNDSTLKTLSIVGDSQNKIAIKEIVSIYLLLKNAFTEDNSTAAANAGKKLEAAIKNFRKDDLTADQKKAFEDIEDDAREHAEHIGKNGGNIAHQREHFEMLSKDIYDLVKTFGGGQVLYKDFCPMYNNGKGAFWLSESKEIKNPYFGKTMPICGNIVEELR